MAMLKEYFDLYKSKIKEYGEKTAVLYQNGAFMECYEKDEHYLEKDRIGNAQQIAQVLNYMKYTGKYFGQKTFINFTGFTISAVDKYTNILLNAGYTVIIVEELEKSSEKTPGNNIKRGITHVYSPSLLPLDYHTSETNNLVGLFIKVDYSIILGKQINKDLKGTLECSFCCINNSTNDIEISESIFNFKNEDMSIALEEIYRILYRYFPKELQVKIQGNILTDKIINYLKEINENVKIQVIEPFDIIYKNYKKKDYQNEYLSNLYKHMIIFGDTLTFLDFTKLRNETVINFMYTIDFMGKHSLKYITNLNKPKIINECNYLLLELNTLNQLNIIDGLFDIINYTKTSIGKRFLKSLLCKPLKNPNDIQKRYNINEEYINSSCSDNVSLLLSKISDIERLHRKMGLSLLHPYEFYKLNNTYTSLLQIIDLVNEIKELKYIIPDKNVLEEYITEYTALFNLTEMKNHSLNTNKDTITNYFNKDQIKELDIIQDKIKVLENQRETMRIQYNDLIDKDTNGNMIKLEYTERDGYSFACTKIRYQLLLSKLSTESQNLLKVKSNVSNSTKFYTESLIKLSSQILSNRDLLNTKIKLHYQKNTIHYLIN
jgi:DNA mismatch repair protein MutS